MFNFQAHKAALAIWYADMAANPATVDQARHSVKALQDKFPHDYGDLGQLVAQRMKESNESREDRPQSA